VDSLNVAGRRIGPGEPPYIIAEIGANHNGDFGLCRQLVDAAHAAGADAVKFQSWSKASLISRAEYVRNATYGGGRAGESLEDEVERYQLTADQHRQIATYCGSAGVTFFSSCFSEEEVELLETLDVPAYKIASMDVNHVPLLERVARTGRPVFLSTGMATLGEVERAVGTLTGNGAGPVVLLHCVSLYPTPPADVNLRQLAMWRDAFGLPVGYSDHTLGSAVALAAVALGAVAIEKHFTLDRALPGWDHGISIEPAELAALVGDTREVAAALGCATRRVGELERAQRARFRRRMVARHALARGARIGPDDVTFKRPGTGVQPDELRYVTGRALVRDIAAEEELAWSDLS
jgi:N,N'-diacetyllegionaminate synthase